tara:strand:+ start:818 stop:1336 length:519 start_codon:yes stop_codon:yes gene_type:complete
MLRLFFILFLVSCTNNTDLVQDFVNIKLPAEEMTDAEILHTKDGKLKVKISANKITRYKEKEPNIIFSDSLMVTFYDDSSNIESILKSEKAFIDNKKNIMLAAGNVILTNNINMLNSEELIWDRQKNIIYTEEKVKIQTKKELILGEGFKSNPNFTKYEITKISGIFNLNNK